MISQDPEFTRVVQLAAALHAALERLAARYGQKEELDEQEPRREDPFGFITADAERESLRITAEHPAWTAAEVANEVRARLPTYDTSDKGVRFYWKIARKDPRKRALLPPQRLT